MNVIYTVQPKTGLRAWLARRIELFSVNATLRAAEKDREYLTSQYESLPSEIHQKDLDIGELRVKQAILRNG